ncbi:restriction endonuclease [Streptomyces sp. enrichment culture]|uniref:restriction endonuclease n=1 Tax=Streptomyces sp. enrichment culture TaxID=1795815 RepID=UPI003F55084A
MAAARKPRRTAARKRREQRVKAAATGGAVALVLLVAYWSEVWPYLLAALLLGGAGAGGWWLWRTDRLLRGGDGKWRREEAVRAGHRTLAEVDAMTGTEFEDFVVGLCRRDGCTEVRRVGGSHDDGADVLGRLPDGRSMVIQCKRYTPRNKIPSREVRDLLGAKVHFKADVAVFVATTYFTAPAERFATHNGIVAVHRDHLGLWNSGASLPSLTAVNGAGQGTRPHQRRRRETYG